MGGAVGNVSEPLLVIIAHHSRGGQAEALAGRVGADAVLTDYGSRGARWAHRQALLWSARRRERVWVLEDDALAPHDFRARAEAWGERFPSDLVSGYLGRQRPPQYQGQIRSKLTAADARGLDWITLRARAWRLLQPSRSRVRWRAAVPAERCRRLRHWCRMGQAPDLHGAVTRRPRRRANRRETP